MQASGLIEFIPFIRTSAIWSQILFLFCVFFFFLISHISLLPLNTHLFSSHCGGGRICWVTVWGALIPVWRPEVADGCDISCLVIWQDMSSLHTVVCDTPTKVDFKQL